MLAYLSLGSNIRPREQYIEQACTLLNEQCGIIISRSRNYYSQPWGYISDNEYLNICLCIDTQLSPIDLLDITQKIEQELGRTQKNIYADRPIDIDILYYFDEKGPSIHTNTPRLTIPHPLIKERDFVLVPLREILVNVRHALGC